MTAIIIDDGEKNHLLLKKLLSYCSVKVEILTSAYSIEEGIQQVKALNPDLIFLDIQFPNDRLGFELLEAFPEPRFQVVFISGYKVYGVNAVGFGALDYLVKPINLSLLDKALQKAEVRHSKRLFSQKQYDVLLDTFHRFNTTDKRPSRISISTQEGIFFREIKDIVRLEAKDSYTEIIFTPGQKDILASINLGEYELRFKSYPEFVRVHRSYMVNLNFVERYVKGDGGYLILKDGRSILVSRKYKDELMKRLLKF